MFLRYKIVINREVNVCSLPEGEALCIFAEHICAGVDVELLLYLTVSFFVVVVFIEFPYIFSV